MTTHSELMREGAKVNNSLKPCPFCGADRAPGLLQLLREGCQEGEPDAYSYTIHCRSCGADGPWAKSQTNAGRHWNMRAGLDGEAIAYLIRAAEITLPHVEPDQSEMLRHALEKLRR